MAAVYTDVRKLSGGKLAQLKNTKKTIEVFHKRTPETHVPQPVCAIPLDVINAFSKKAARLFDVKFAIKRIGQKPVTVIMVVGSTRGSVKNLFKWMLDCCDGRGLKQYTPAVNNPFYNAQLDLAIAKVWEIPYFIQQIEPYVEKQLRGKLSAEDVVELYKAGAYFIYRPMTGPDLIPATEIGALLRMPDCPKELFDRLAAYVGHETFKEIKEFRDMETKVSSRSGDSKAKSTIVTRKYPLEKTYAYVKVVRAIDAEFDRAVNEVINLRKKMDKQAREETVDTDVPELDRFLVTWRSEIEANAITEDTRPTRGTQGTQMECNVVEKAMAGQTQINVPDATEEAVETKGAADTSDHISQTTANAGPGANSNSTGQTQPRDSLKHYKNKKRGDVGYVTSSRKSKYSTVGHQVAGDAFIQAQIREREQTRRGEY